MSDKTSPLYLSPNQRSLLVAALTSNKSIEGTAEMATGTQNTPANRTSTSASAPNSSRIEFDDSPYLDYPLDDEDESYNFDEDGQMFGDLPDEDSPDNGTTDPEHLHDKRKSMSAQDQDEEGGGKRREGSDRQAKKPGRKPLMSEPTSKRKAQNRAAQRAFRERKEQHLKDLETKVEDLEKVSQVTTQENSKLRAQVEQLQVEAKEYRKRLSWVSTTAGARQSSGVGQSRNTALGSGSSDFQFQFPKFGDSPNMGTVSNNNNSRSPQNGVVHSAANMPLVQSASPAASVVARNSISDNVRNSRHNSQTNSPMNNLTNSPHSYTQTHQNSIDSFSGLFSPSILEATRNSPQGYFGADNTATGLGRASSTNNNSYSSIPGLYSGSSVSNTDSPGSSSEAHHNMSSIGTSPDANFNSPNNKSQDVGLNTIDEMGSLGQWNFNTNGAADFDPSGFSWLAHQNGGAFDPVLFGDYRDTTNNVLSQDFGTFFNDAYPLPDLGSPNHNYVEVSNQQPDLTRQPDLIAQVDAAKDGDVSSRMSEAPKLMTCNKIWDRLQSMEKFRNGEIDIDNLCSELRAKAKCSEGGAVVDEKHVNKILGI